MFTILIISKNLVRILAVSYISFRNLKTFLGPLNAEDGSAVIFRNVGRWKSTRCDIPEELTQISITT